MTPIDEVIKQFWEFSDSNGWTFTNAAGVRIDDSTIALIFGLMMGAFTKGGGALMNTPEIWLAVHDQHEMYVYPCASEEAAHEHLALRGLRQREDVPEGWSMEETVRNWNELTGDEYMRVEGPLFVDMGRP